MLKNFFWAETTFSSGSKSLKSDSTNTLKPLNTDRVQIRANEASMIPATDMAEITFITLWLFLAKRYLRAMKNGKFTF